MLLVILGESCTGKSTLAAALQEHVALTYFEGKEYLKLEKNPQIAQDTFISKLKDAVHQEAVVLWVTSEYEQLSLLPHGATLIGMYADYDLILERFEKRMGGNVPEPVQMMLKRKHGQFDSVDVAIRIHNSDYDVQSLCKLLRIST